MPLYTYYCETCGPMDMKMPVADIDKPLTCPVCEYNRAMEGVKNPPKFEEWTESQWDQHPKDTSGHVLLTKLIDAPAIRIN